MAANPAENRQASPVREHQTNPSSNPRLASRYRSSKRPIPPLPEPLSRPATHFYSTIRSDLSCNPTVLLSDEPTTALDVTVQIQILLLLLLRELQRELGMAVVFVTHDVGAAAEVSDRLAVMYAGRFVEMGTARDVLRKRAHPYTEGLLAANLHGVEPGSRLVTIPSVIGMPPSSPFKLQIADLRKQSL
jgi:peptide/nickel transport system ATP-binding protein